MCIKYVYLLTLYLEFTGNVIDDVIAIFSDNWNCVPWAHMLIALWHNSLIRISTFREFLSQQFHEGHNLFANYLDEDVPAMFEVTL